MWMHEFIITAIVCHLIPSSCPFCMCSSSKDNALSNRSDMLTAAQLGLRHAEY